MTTTMQKVEKPEKKRKTRSLDKVRARAGWFFVLPFLIGFIGIYVPIVFESIKSTFYGGIATRLEFVGWENYQEALFGYTTGDGTTFLVNILAGLQQMAIDIPAILIFSLFMAVLLNQKMAGRAAFRAIFFVPVILSTGIMESIESANILGTYMGESSGIDDGSGSSAASEIVSAMDIEMLFSNMKVGQGLVKYVVDIINNIYAIVNRSGVQMLIFLAGLQSISPAIYEACRIDGATGWETFWKITFPMISPMILVNAVYTIIDSFTTESNTVMSYISGVASGTSGEVVSTAMAWIYFLIVVLILAIVAGIMSMFVFYQRRD